MSLHSCRYADSEDANNVDVSEGSRLTEERLTKEEWRTINNLLSYQPDEEIMPHTGKDMQNMILYLVTVSVRQAAARIIDVNQTEIICGRFEQLHVSTKFKNRSTHCDVLLKFYGLSAPGGSLAQVCWQGVEDCDALCDKVLKLITKIYFDWDGNLIEFLTPFIHIFTFF